MSILSESRILADFTDFADFWGLLCIQHPLLCIEFPCLLSESGLEDLQDYKAFLIEIILYRITQTFYSTSFSQKTEGFRFSLHKDLTFSQLSGTIVHQVGGHYETRQTPCLLSHFSKETDMTEATQTYPSLGSEEKDKGSYSR